MMTPERMQLVKRLFHEALLLPADARSAWLDRACEGDMEIRSEVETLLAAHDADTGGSLRPIRFADRGVVRDASAAASQIREMLADALKGQYEIIRVLGRGGMGEVYLARHVALDIRVAIKVLRPELVTSLESRHRFLREARIAARLRHPGIVRLHHYLQAGDLWCFIMDFVPGEALDKRIAIEGALPCSETRQILIDLAAALDYAHAHDVVHRDIKPGNILFEDRSAMLADFGIAKIGDASTITPPNETRGTPAYMSPEQLEGGTEVDGRSDIYSLGLVGYAMLTGAEPYPGMSVGETIARKLTEDPPPIAQAARFVTPGLARVITRCLSRDPALRYPDARALREALEHADCAPAPELHPGLVELPGFGQWSLVWATFWTTYGLLGDHGLRELILTLIVAFLVPVGFALQLWNLGRHPHPLREVVKVSYWPPIWWGMWWPAPLRRPTDLYMRLPWQARAVRVVLSMFFVGMPAVIIVQSRLSTPSPRLAIAEYALLVATALATALGMLWSFRQHVTAKQMTRLLFGATALPSAWRAKPIARLIAPARGVLAPSYDDAFDHGRAIAEMVELLPRNVATLSRPAAKLTRQLLKVVKRFDAELVALNRSANPAEIEKLRMELVRLGPATATEPGSQRELRELIEQQIDLRASMRHDADLAAYARGEVFDLIRSMWAHLRRLHEEITTEGADPLGAAEALRVLLDEVKLRLRVWAPDPDPDGEDPGGEPVPPGPAVPPFPTYSAA